jgi:integral membrane sensor domain MASE1
MVSSALPAWLSRIAATHVNSPETRDSSVFANQTLRTIGFAVLVGLSYYVGTRIGFGLTPHGQPNSTFWPPNAILLAAFLPFPRRIW